VKTNRNLRRAKKDLKDASSEYSHRVQAGAERAKRELAGDAMTTTQKTKSAVKEAGHRMAAGVDKTKRKIRDRAR
jgi:hypothetical protein